MQLTPTRPSQLATIVFGAPDWLPIVIGISLLLIAAVAWSYWRSSVSPGVKAFALTLKILGITLLVICLLEPLFSGTRARPGANVFALLADNSQSMTLRDKAGEASRGKPILALADRNTPWLQQLRRDFDVRSYAFDTQVKSLGDDEKVAFDGRASNLGAALDRLDRRFVGQPLAGVLLMTDGGATDVATIEKLLARHAAANGGAGKLPPIYPVLAADDAPAEDVSVAEVAVTQTNFEDTPVTLAARLAVTGYKGRTVAVQLLDEQGTVRETQQLKIDNPDQPPVARFKLKPEQVGVSFYRVRAAAEDELAQFDTPDKTREATTANNARMVAIDRGQGPYRVLYVCGRPNWEYKFLSRGLAEDTQVQLVGLLRIAKREPKFAFIGRKGEGFNPLFRGFDPENKNQVEQYDKPVMIRLGTKDEEELRGGFPMTADVLNQYHAIIIDDLESEFFTQDQLQLIKEFVRQRGGGLLMLGGQETFKNGKYDRSPLGDILPVYADEVPANPAGAKFRLSLTREGWLEPWVRMRPDERTENKRVAEMPPFLALNQVRGIKPGATVLARVATEDGTPVPALVEQRFGAGRVGALLIGDLWRWGLKRPADSESDLERSWRQTIRWLVGDVPKRVELTATPRQDPDAAVEGSLQLSAQVRDPAYAPLDNAAVSIRITTPDGSTLELPAEASDRKSGQYQATYVPRMAGAFRAVATARAADGSDVGQAAIGWTSDPAADEFANLKPNRELLQRLATATGGQIVDPGDLDKFVADLPTKKAQVTDPYIMPIWHTPWVFALAILLLTAEWGLRRMRGLP
ncbi:glutamine amidotransferase [Humisphaera borealis]|uniref:Putative glutamine amidotransferase domain-containing protein n=1 Tax=Humisphaera borealis TaxID=2807512 RepID=A0A7M2WUS3_9BACT|nr:glutamine amidotransferase [Humisphaera borealis]QOV88290.1 hypothetical protein IPV69_18830 [Humisphaera borealis]